MKNNYLLLVTNQTIVSKLKKESNITFLFPISKFSVGFPTSFLVDEIKEEDAFIFVNRIMDAECIEDFKEFLKKLPSNIKGIVFDDVGVLEVLNTIPNKLTKILFLNHFNCNYLSINAYLEYVDSVVVSTDITEGEVDEILKKASKPLVLFTFGYINIMYSRRLLLTNYNDHFNRKVDPDSKLTNDLGQDFKIVQNEYGTVIYTGEPFNGLSYLGKENVMYYMISTLFLTDEEVLRIIHGEGDLEHDYPYRYLSQEETIVRIKEREND